MEKKKNLTEHLKDVNVSFAGKSKRWGGGMSPRRKIVSVCADFAHGCCLHWGKNGNNLNVLQEGIH